MKTLLLATAILSLPAVAMAADPVSDSSPQVMNDDATPASEKVICRNEKKVGTRLAATRVCLTAAQWKVRRAEQRQAIERVQTNRSTSGGG